MINNLKGGNPMENERVPLVKRLKELEEEVNNAKSKPLSLPMKAKAKGSKLKKSWIGVLRIGENGNITATKTQIIGSCFRIKDQTSTGTYHTTDGREILFWNGKFPVIVQEDKKINPKNFRFNEGVNETYGQEKIIATILKDTIKVKKPVSGGFIIILIIIAVGFLLGKYVFNWF